MRSETCCSKNDVWPAWVSEGWRGDGEMKWVRGEEVKGCGWWGNEWERGKKRTHWAS